MGNKKPHLIFIYGFVAVGKLTVAKELAKLTKYKILHNHMIVDLFGDLFGHERPGTVEKAEIKEWFYFELTKKLIGTGDNFIFTHTYSDSYVSKTGMTDLDFVKKIKEIVTELGGIFCPVYLFCSEQEMLKRLKNKSRKSHKKLRSLKIMKELMKRENFKTPAPLRNNFLMDTTENSPKKVAKMIKEHFKLD
ncbi:MAG: AAA family ATPase [Candidatus Paceibacterota bacterium]|jgi:shikimate kinase|nr:AAA family ATPase [bacterium]